MNVYAFHKSPNTIVKGETKHFKLEYIFTFFNNVIRMSLIDTRSWKTRFFIISIYSRKSNLYVFIFYLWIAFCVFLVSILNIFEIAYYHGNLFCRLLNMDILNNNIIPYSLTQHTTISRSKLNKTNFNLNNNDAMR